MPSRSGWAGSMSDLAAASAASAHEEPSCTTSRPRSAAQVLRSTAPLGSRHSTVPDWACTVRVACASFVSTISSL